MQPSNSCDSDSQGVATFRYIPRFESPRVYVRLQLPNERFKFVCMDPECDMLMVEVWVRRLLHNPARCASSETPTFPGPLSDPIDCRAIGKQRSTPPNDP
eukprot:5226070-Pyramimonas_sp.AAC.1